MIVTIIGLMFLLYIYLFFFFLVRLENNEGKKKNFWLPAFSPLQCFHSFLLPDHCLDISKLGKQPVAWEEYCVE